MKTGPFGQYWSTIPYAFCHSALYLSMVAPSITLLAFAGLPNFGCFVVAPSIRYNKTFGFIVVTLERQQSFNKNWLRQKYIWAILVYNL